MASGNRLSRREALSVGAVGCLGLTLPNLLAARARAAQSGKRAAPSFGKAKSCIMIFLKGGPSHLDTFDPKPDGPTATRGPFQTISTNVPGIQVSEHVPMLARQADKFTIVRSVFHKDANHPSAFYEMTTGHAYPRVVNQSEIGTREDHPHIGASVAAIQHTMRPGPPFVVVPDYFIVNGQFRSGQHAGILGTRFDPLVPGGDPNSESFRTIDLGLVPQVEPNRLRDRHTLLGTINSATAAAEQEKACRDFLDHSEKAFSILTSGRTQQAFDLRGESAALRDRYGRTQIGQSCLLARRLVEAGVGLVHVNCMSATVDVQNSWDTHKDNFNTLKNILLPRTDRAVAALFEDLAARGLLDETMVVLTGEFGRSPKINDNVGRDHWPTVFSVLVAGAGIPGGRVYGASDKSGAQPADRPLHSGKLSASVFHALGIDPATQVLTPSGRPWLISDETPELALWS